jgi:hypothetical protein
MIETAQEERENLLQVTLQMNEIAFTTPGVGATKIGRLSNDDGNAEDRRPVKMNLYFTFEFRNFLDLFSTPIGLKTCSN